MNRRDLPLFAELLNVYPRRLVQLKTGHVSRYFRTSLDQLSLITSIYFRVPGCSGVLIDEILDVAGPTAKNRVSAFGRQLFRDSWAFVTNGNIDFR